MVTAEKMEEALHNLSQTDRLIGERRGALISAEILCKRVRKRKFVEAQGKTIAEREAEAEISDDAIKADAEYVNAVVDFERLKALRETWDMTIRVWQSQESSRRLGQV